MKGINEISIYKIHDPFGALHLISLNAGDFGVTPLKISTTEI